MRFFGFVSQQHITLHFPVEHLCRLLWGRVSRVRHVCFPTMPSSCKQIRYIVLGPVSFDQNLVIHILCHEVLNPVFLLTPVTMGTAIEHGTNSRDWTFCFENLLFGCHHGSNTKRRLQSEEGRIREEDGKATDRIQKEDYSPRREEYGKNTGRPRIEYKKKTTVRGRKNQGRIREGHGSNTKRLLPWVAVRRTI